MSAVREDLLAAGLEVFDRDGYELALRRLPELPEACDEE